MQTKTLPFLLVAAPTGFLQSSSKGERCVYSVYSAHRRKDIYGEDADIFRPERWGEGKPRGWEFCHSTAGLEYAWDVSVPLFFFDKSLLYLCLALRGGGVLHNPCTSCMIDHTPRSVRSILPASLRFFRVTEGR